MNTVFLHLGSNEDEPLKQLLTALGKIEVRIGKISSYSQIYKTEAWGKKDQNDFLNMAIEVMTKLKPKELLKKTQEIEIEMGRKEKEKWASRIIDIDILFYNNQKITEPELTIPHPHIEKRNFVLIPMFDIAADFVHPLLGKTIEELYIFSEDTCEVTLL